MKEQHESAPVSVRDRAIKVNPGDNVATALVDLEPGKATIIGDNETVSINVSERIQAGHKIALYEIPKDSVVMKYGAVIGWSSQSIQVGEWVHLHNCRSGLDERSSSLDRQTGEPSDTPYE